MIKLRIAGHEPPKPMDTEVKFRLVQDGNDVNIIADLDGKGEVSSRISLLWQARGYSWS